MCVSRGQPIYSGAHMRATDHTACCCAQIADHRAHNTPFSTYVTEVVCDFGAAPPQAATSSPAIEGMTPSKPPTRRRHADDTPPKSSAWRKTPTATGLEAAVSPTRTAQYRLARQNSPNNNRAGPLRYKTLPAQPKWPNLAQSTHAGRVLYRFHHHEPKQGEFCIEHKAELGLATTPQQAPQVRKEPKQPQEPAG